MESAFLPISMLLQDLQRSFPVSCMSFPVPPMYFHDSRSCAESFGINLFSHAEISVPLGRVAKNNRLDLFEIKVSRLIDRPNRPLTFNPYKQFACTTET